jgi:hypothetical protein
MLLTDYVKRNFPKKYEKLENCAITCSYNLIFFYSKCQIIYNKIHYNAKKIISSNPHLKKLIDNISKPSVSYDLEYINKGNIIAKYDINLADITDLNDNNFCIFSDLNGENNNLKENKKIIHSFPITKDYEVSNISFMLVEINVGEKVYKIILKNEKYNYYLVDNIFDKNFFTYYLMNYTSDNLTYDYINSQQLILNFIDNNVEQKQLDMTNGLNSIVIQKDCYLINEK